MRSKGFKIKASAALWWQPKHNSSWNLRSTIHFLISVGFFHVSRSLYFEYLVDLYIGFGLLLNHRHESSLACLGFTHHGPPWHIPTNATRYYLRSQKLHLHRLNSSCLMRKSRWFMSLGPKICSLDAFLYIWLNHIPIIFMTSYFSIVKLSVRNGVWKLPHVHSFIHMLMYCWRIICL